jgi:hypothetical protein
VAIHLDPELAGAGERSPSKLDFKIFSSLKIFDRNSHVRFHKSMGAAALQKPVMHDLVHRSPYINSYAISHHEHSQLHIV